MTAARWQYVGYVVDVQSWCGWKSNDSCVVDGFQDGIGDL